MLVKASLSSNGIQVHGKGITIPHKFGSDFRLCKIEAGSEFKLAYLKDRYEYFNRHLFGGVLHEPEFVIDRRSVRLGAWYPFYKRISIAKKMFLVAQESRVLYVLAHEMAHQYVSQVLHSPEKDAHGPAWQHVMASIGLPTEAKYDEHPDTLLTKEKVEKREELKKVLDNNTKLVDGPAFSVSKPTVMRFVVPGRGDDYPVICIPQMTADNKMIIGYRVSKEGVLQREAAYSVNYLVFPGPLKIKTPLYRRAAELASNLRGHWDN